MTKFDFSFNAALNTLTISVDFAKKAGNVNSKEYRKLCELRRENPGLIVKQRTRVASKRCTYKEMEAALRRIDENGNLVKAFKLVLEISKSKKAPYAYVYNWFKKQMDAAKAEKKSEKKSAAEMNKEEKLKRLEELEGGIAFKPSKDTEAEEEAELEEEREKAEA